MRPKRLISLLVAVCMMITMLPLSAVTAFATDTSTVHEANDDEGIYRYAYKKNEDGETVTITKFLGPVDPTNNGPYVITIPTTLDKYTVTGIGKWAFDRCGLHTLTIEGPIESMGLAAFYECTKLETISFGENIKTIGEQAFQGCSSLTKVTIPDSVTSIGLIAFGGCCKLTTLSLGENVETIGGGAFFRCSSLSNITIPKKVKVIESGYSGTPSFYRTFAYCSGLKYIILPAELTTFEARLDDCPACVIYYNNDEDHAKDLLKNNYYLRDAVQNGHQLLCLCHVTFDAKGGNLTYDKVPVYETEKITETLANNLEETDLDAINHPTRTGYNFIGWYTTPDGKPEDGKFDVKETAITKDITLYARWKFDPNALDCHQLTVTGGTVTVKYDGSDVTSTLNSNTDATTGQKTYYVPEGAEVTVTLDKTAVPNGKVFDSWSTGDFSLPTGDYKATSITFTMNSGVDIAAQYRDAATDHTHDTAVCHPLTVTGGTVTVKYDGSDVTSTLNSRTDETTVKKTYYVPDGAEVTVTLDQTAVPNGKVFDSWSTGNLSLTGQDYKAENITFTMRSGVNVSATYRDAAADHTPGTAACHPLTVTGGIVTVKNGDKDVTDTLTVTTDETTGKKTYSVPEGATVTVTLDKTLIPEGMVFDIWSTGKFSLPLGQDYKAESITFTMNTMSSDADIAAQYRDATIEDDGPNVLGTAAIIGTAAVGGAVLGYQAYSLGTEFAGKLMALPYFPSNRSALAMMLWEDAGKPMPESELLYPDVGQEEQDMDLQHAARWAMENELIPDLNDEGTAPEEMKFFPANPVSKLDVLNAWQKAQELKNN